jgi:GIY-YIG catalytic domain
MDDQVFSCYTIYQIIIKNTDFIYVGSTRNYERRIKLHQRLSGIPYPIKLYTTIHQNGGWINTEHSILEVALLTRKDALRREQFHMTALDANLNTNKAYLTEEDVVNYAITYRANNKDKIYRRVDCPCGRSYSASNKVHHLDKTIHKIKMQEVLLNHTPIIQDVAGNFIPQECWNMGMNTNANQPSHLALNL